jgi:large subunit ribosomal protein L6
MSRIGKKAVPLPKGVTATIDGQTVSVKGPKGQLAFSATDNVVIAQNDDGIKIDPADDSQGARAAWGMSRTQIANLVKGVSEGFEKRLEIYSHDVRYPIPDGIKIECPKPTEIVISGSNRQQIGQIAAEIRQFRPPEPYKGKGIKYAGERIIRKEGKKK